MSYRVTEEISSFWYTLGLPVFFGVITCFFILYIIGKSNRQKLIEWVVDDHKYVLEHGVYIPFGLSKKARAFKKIEEFFGISQFRAILIIFMGLVVMFGGYNIIRIIFQPQLTHNANILFSSGVDNHMLAVLWSKTSNPRSLHSILQYIDENTDVNNRFPVLYAVESYLHFYILISIVTLFLVVMKKGNIEKKEIRRNACRAISILLILLIVIYAFQIQNHNEIVERKCSQAYSELDKKMLIPDYDEIEVYIKKIEDMKAESSRSMFYGAYSLKMIYFINDIKSFINKMRMISV